MLFSNKGILPILWELNPGHPNLLEARFKGPGSMDNYVCKPLMSREGANIQIIKNGQPVAATQGDYGEEGFIYQDYHSVGAFNGKFPVIGSWIVDGVSAGIGIRESEELITNNLSSFVPHMFE